MRETSDNQMMLADAVEYPDDLQNELQRARRIVWITIGYLLSVISLMYLVAGASQAMKSALIEDILSLIPGAVFIVASYLSTKTPTSRFPYGYHRAVTIAFLVGAIALLTMGVYLIYESVLKLVEQSHPALGDVTMLGQTVWRGWLMIPVLLYSSLVYFLGRRKRTLSKKLHDKVLYTDGDMNSADWQTAFAAIIGILGIRAGLWWADAAAALLISLSIVYDGYHNLTAAVADLMNRVPQSIGEDKPDPLIEEITETLRALSWVEDVHIRLREEGHVYFGEGFVVPKDSTNLTEKIEQAAEHIQTLNWRINNFVVMPVSELPTSLTNKPRSGKDPA